MSRPLQSTRAAVVGFLRRGFTLPETLSMWRHRDRMRGGKKYEFPGSLARSRSHEKGAAVVGFLRRGPLSMWRHRDRMRGGKRSGFTLLEMMVAMGILAVSYVALMEAASGSMRLSTYGKQITIATFLAQSKMEEEEERLTREGFPDMDDTQDGNFEELGYPSFKWVLQVNKVELPLEEAFGQLLNQFGAKGDDAQNASGSMGNLQSMMGGQLGDKLKGQLGGMMGGAGGASALSGMLNPDMLKGQVEMLGNMLEQALREVQLTVYWEEGGPGKQLVLTTHLVQVPGSTSTGAPTGPNAGMQPGMNPAEKLKNFLPPAVNKTLGQNPPMGRSPNTHRGVPPISPKLR